MLISTFFLNAETRLRPGHARQHVMLLLQLQPAISFIQNILPLACSSHKLLSVLAWGRNVEGQCGVEGDVPLVKRPTALLDLHGSPVVSLHAGKLSSGAVLRNGEAWTWGEGKSGKLGHGSTDNIKSPSRIESLWGRAEVSSMAMGDTHTLYLDACGSVWSCGENKEGQCGLGTPLELLAQQHRKSFYASVRQWESLAGRQARASSSASSGGAASSSSSSSSANRDKFSRYLRSLIEQGQLQQQQAGHAHADWHLQQHQQQQRQELRMMLQGAAGGSSGRAHQHVRHGGSAGVAGTGSLGGFGAPFSGFGGDQLDGDGQLQAFGLQPGQSHTPQRIGRDQHPLMDMHLGPAGAAARQTLSGGAAASVAEPEEEEEEEAESERSIEGEQVVGVAATKYFSVLLTGRGEVWTFGACYNGSLGSERSWSTSALPVSDDLASAIAARGGATKVAAGGTFAMCLTVSGKVLVWGKLGNGSPGVDLSTAGAAGAKVAVREVEGLPPIRDFSAGHQHALLTDGERVWAIGRWLGASGDEAGAAGCTAPREMLHLPTEGVSKVVAGAHASAAVSGDGRLHMWGRLLDSHHVDGLFRKFYGDLDLANVDWGWPGFGGTTPALVPGLEGVRDVALGGWHALVLLD